SPALIVLVDLGDGVAIAGHAGAGSVLVPVLLQVLDEVPCAVLHHPAAVVCAALHDAADGKSRPARFLTDAVEVARLDAAEAIAAADLTQIGEDVAFIHAAAALHDKRRVPR